MCLNNITIESDNFSIATILMLKIQICAADQSRNKRKQQILRQNIQFCTAVTTVISRNFLVFLFYLSPRDSVIRISWVCYCTNQFFSIMACCLLNYDFAISDSSQNFKSTMRDAGCNQVNVWNFDCCVARCPNFRNWILATYLFFSAICGSVAACCLRAKALDGEMSKVCWSAKHFTSAYAFSPSIYAVRDIWTWLLILWLASAESGIVLFCVYFLRDCYALALVYPQLERTLWTSTIFEQARWSVVITPSNFMYDLM